MDMLLSLAANCPVAHNYVSGEKVGWENALLVS